MKQFLYEAQPCRTVFGEGTRRNIRKEVERLNLKNVLVISTSGLSGSTTAEHVAVLLRDLCKGIFSKAVQHVPIENVYEALDFVKSNNIDGLVAVGGGSPIGLAKAVALETELPIVALPTTYAGSEMTSVWGITENGVKRTGTNSIVKPKTVIYDPELTLSIPANLSVTSGVNSVAHCVEALYSESRNPITSLLAEEGIRSIARSLRRIVENPDDLEARSKAFYGAWLGGTVLGSVGMALHHKLCHTLGGTFKLPHAETHTVLISYVISYNSDYAPEAMEVIARSLQCNKDDVASTLYDLIQSLGGPVSLESIGFQREDIEKAAELAVKNPYYNPRPIDKGSIRDLLDRAYHGIRPE
ncbi:maleylacetate reductase [Neobacillus kokaensis]|uniref:Maleylacetate reductase n=1 Tax=Neobacillus kokaensis TaxID=2759023 RepID=A0ABQ3N4E7_9BACI|nr:maleylacetate reductase [Neobacillus kokaensis]GHH99815.1 maleylacetate reductase [Neobacillus kokaensis]